MSRTEKVSDRASAPRRRGALDRLLFKSAEYLSTPPGFYAVLAVMALCTALVPLGLTDVVTYALSVAAIIITGVVLIQGFRDTAAIHAKLDEIVLALRETRNDVIGLEHADPDAIMEKLQNIEKEADACQPIDVSRGPDGHSSASSLNSR